MATMSQEEMLSALAELLQQRQEGEEVPGVSARELAKALGISHNLVLKRLKPLEDAGLVEAVAGRRPDAVGRPCWCPVYRPKRNVDETEKNEDPSI